jgi:3-oxoacid CoA-transferase subunit A
LNKVVDNFDDAVADIYDGATVIISQFAGPSGSPYYLVHALHKHGAKNLTLISSTSGGIGLTLDYEDHKILFENRQVKKLIATFPFPISPSRHTPAEDQILSGEVELELVPLGTFVERIRAGGAGIPAFYTPTGYGTMVDKGKDVKWIDGRPYILEYSFKADFALIRAYKADKLGNLIYRGTQRQYNPVMAMNAKVTIVEVDEIVDVGDLDQIGRAHV